jgi:gentisate 1,2-dioxygenase
VYRWKQSDAVLDKLLARTGAPMASIEFVDPTSGGPALPTMTCALHRVVSGRRTPSRRKSGSSIFVVHHGSGESVIAGQVFRWAPGDMFVVPSWQPYDHQADSTADLFEVSDEATLRALHLFRDETLEQHQDVTGVFEPRHLPAA